MWRSKSCPARICKDSQPTGDVYEGEFKTENPVLDLSVEEDLTVESTPSAEQSVNDPDNVLELAERRYKSCPQLTLEPSVESQDPLKVTAAELTVRLWRNRKSSETSQTTEDPIVQSIDDVSCVDLYVEKLLSSPKPDTPQAGTSKEKVLEPSDGENWFGNLFLPPDSTKSKTETIPKCSPRHETMYEIESIAIDESYSIESIEADTSDSLSVSIAPSHQIDTESDTEASENPSSYDAKSISNEAITISSTPVSSIQFPAHEGSSVLTEDSSVITEDSSAYPRATFVPIASPEIFASLEGTPVKQQKEQNEETKQKAEETVEGAKKKLSRGQKKNILKKKRKAEQARMKEEAEMSSKKEEESSASNSKKKN